MAECAPRFAAARGAGSPSMLAVCPPRPSSPRCRPAAALAGLDAVPAYRKSPSVPRPALSQPRGRCFFPPDLHADFPASVPLREFLCPQGPR